MRLLIYLLGISLLGAALSACEPKPPKPPKPKIDFTHHERSM